MDLCGVECKLCNNANNYKLATHLKVKKLIDEVGVQPSEKRGVGTTNVRGYTAYP